MTNKQREKQKRNEEIHELYKTTTIEEIARRFNLSVAHIYRVIQLK